MISFDTDPEVYDVGTYSFASVKNRQLANSSRGGFGWFPPLELKFKLRNGKEYHEVLDIETLMTELDAREDLPQVNEMEGGGMAALKVKNR